MNDTMKLALSNFILRFDTDDISERAIYPSSPSQSNGLEDARFVMFTEDDGSVTYYATFTAYDGTNIMPEMLETTDFKKFKVYCNRGTSGIDGSLSTAAGYASASDKINTIILGDLSFFYDSNALWNKYIGSNLRIIVIHNGGGNIFSMIKGPSESPAFRKFFFAENNTSAAGIAHTFGLNYIKAENDIELDAGLTELFRNHHKPALLEIFTNADLNSKMFRGLFNTVKNAWNQIAMAMLFH